MKGEGREGGGEGGREGGGTKEGPLANDHDRHCKW